MLIYIRTSGDEEWVRSGGPKPCATSFRDAMLATLVAIAIAIAIGSTLVACGSAPIPTARVGASQILHRSIGGEPQSLIPQSVGDTFSFEVLRDLFEGLTAESASGEVVPGMADGWSVTDGGKKYQFHLRRNAKWSNGEPISAE